MDTPKRRSSSFSIDVQNVTSLAFSREYLPRYCLTTTLIFAMWFVPFPIQMVIDLLLVAGVITFCLKHYLWNNLVMICLAYIHGLIHIFYPFLTYDGRVKGITPFWDVLCHFIMMIYSNKMLGFSLKNDIIYDCWTSIHNKYYASIWGIFLLGSFVNMLASLNLLYKDDGFAAIFFDLSSLPQAISVAYSISSALVNIHNSDSKCMYLHISFPSLCYKRW